MLDLERWKRVNELAANATYQPSAVQQFLTPSHMHTISLRDYINGWHACKCHNPIIIQYITLLFHLHGDQFMTCVHVCFVQVMKTHQRSKLCYEVVYVSTSSLYLTRVGSNWIGFHLQSGIRPVVDRQIGQNRSDLTLGWSV